MKIAILTQPLHINYGGIMQAYAVQQVLKRLGHDVVTLNIDYPDPPSTPWYRHIRNGVVFSVKLCLGILKPRDIFRYYNNMPQNVNRLLHSFTPFVERMLDVSPRLLDEDAIKDYIGKQGFDCYVVGSDQVWRPIYSPYIDWYYLGFLPKESNAKRIALAASFGTSEWEYSEEQTERIKPLARLFDRVSVREEAGVELCHKYLGIGAKHVVDPTMLLTPMDCCRLIEGDRGNTYSMDGCLFSYILDAKPDTDLMLTLTGENLGLQTKSLNVSVYATLPLYASKKTVAQLTPKPVAQWLRGFQEAAFVITDSFHGTVFSILHHRPFIVIVNKARGASRIETLLNTFGLEDRMVVTPADCSKENLMRKIDWESVDKKLDAKRTEFVSFVKEALNQ